MDNDSNRLTKAELIEVEMRLDNHILVLEYNDDLAPFTEKLREAQSELNEYIDNMKDERRQDAQVVTIPPPPDNSSKATKKVAIDND